MCCVNSTRLYKALPKINILFNTIQSHTSFNLPHLHQNHSAPPSTDHVAPADWADLKFLMHSKQARPVWSGSVLTLLMTLSSITRAYLSKIRTNLSCLNKTNISKPNTIWRTSSNYVTLYRVYYHDS